MKYKYINIVLILLGFFCLGLFFSNLKVKTLSDFNSYLNEESLTFRDKDGKKLNLIEYNSNIYMPLTDKGLMLDYTINLDGNTLYLETKTSDYLNISTRCLNDNIFTNDNIYQYDYTFFINWATWCSDCSSLLSNLEDVYAFLEERDITFQIVGLPLDSNLQKVKEYCRELDYEFKNLIVTKEIEYQLQNNLSFIPNIVIVNNKGRIVDTYIGLNIEDIITTIKELPKCNDC